MPANQLIGSGTADGICLDHPLPPQHGSPPCLADTHLDHDNELVRSLCGTWPAIAYRSNHLSYRNTLDLTVACPIGDPLTWRTRFGWSHRRPSTQGIHSSITNDCDKTFSFRSPH